MENLKNKLIIRKYNLEIYEYIKDSPVVLSAIEVENIRNNKLLHIIDKIYLDVLPTLDDFTDKAELYIDQNFNIICTTQRKQGHCWSYEDLEIDRQENKNYFESEDKRKFVPISLRYNWIKIDTIDEKRKKIVSHINEIRNNKNRTI